MAKLWNFMKNKLLLKCSDSMDSIDWLLLDPNGKILEKSENKNLLDLTKRVDLINNKIYVLMVSSDILIKKIHIPKKTNQSKLTKIVPNILEEDLMTGIDSIHFSYGKVHDGELTVALVSNEKLQFWIDKLKENNIKPDVLSPLCLSLNSKENEWQIWIDKGAAVINTGPNSGFSIELDQLGLFLNYLYSNIDIKPNKITVTRSSKDSNKISFDEYPDIAKIIHYNELSVWDVFNKDNKNINLLHHSFGDIADDVNHRRILIHGLILFLIAFFVFTIVEIKYIYSYENLNRELNDKISSIYKDLYPNATDVVSPKLRIERDLNSLSNKEGGAFYDLAFNVGTILSQNQQITLTSLAYKNGALVITVEATTNQSLDSFKSQLKKLPLHIDQKTTTQQKDKLSAVFSITKTGEK